MSSIGLLLAAIVFPILVALLLTSRAFLVRYFTGSLLGVVMILVFAIIGALIAGVASAEHVAVAGVVAAMVLIFVVVFLAVLLPRMGKKGRLKNFKKYMGSIPIKRQAKVLQYLHKHKLMQSDLLELLNQDGRETLVAMLKRQDVTITATEQNDPLLVGISADMAWLLVSAFVEQKLYCVVLRYQYEGDQLAFDKVVTPRGGLATKVLPAILKLPINRKKYATKTMAELAALGEKESQAD